MTPTEVKKKSKEAIELYKAIVSKKIDGIACAIKIVPIDGGVQADGEAAITTSNKLSMIDRYRLLELIIETFEFEEADIIKMMLGKMNHKIGIVKKP